MVVEHYYRQYMTLLINIHNNKCIQYIFYNKWVVTPEATSISWILF